MTLTLKQKLAAATLSVAALGADAACTAGNATCDTQSGPNVAQSNSTGGVTNISTPKFSAHIGLSADAVGAPNPSSGLPMGYISETTSPMNIPLLGAMGRATGITKPADGILELHIENETCLKGVKASDALGRISDDTGNVNYVRFKTIVNSCGGDFNALATELNACEYGTLITGACKDKPTPAPAQVSQAPAPAPAVAAPLAPAPQATASLSGKAGNTFSSTTPSPCGVQVKAWGSKVTSAQVRAAQKRLETSLGCNSK